VLPNEEISRLIPAVGPRTIFLSRRKDFLQGMVLLVFAASAINVMSLYANVSHCCTVSLRCYVTVAVRLEVNPTSHLVLQNRKFSLF
jgi:hypothetical protein